LIDYTNRLRELRIDRDKTQAQIADVLQVRQEYYSKYELGKVPLPLQHLVTLCLYYGVSSDYVLGLPKNLKWPR